MKPVQIVGTGQSLDDITPKQKKIIEKADLLIGGTDQLKLFNTKNIETIEIKNNLSFIVDTINKYKNTKNIVVLGSGDPLFFGIGSYLIKKTGRKNISVLPNISSAAKAFSKINESWQDARLLSLHGKNFQDISDLFSSHKKFCILTDKTRDPAWIAGQLLKKNKTNFTMCVLERLDTDKEKITWFDNLEKIKNFNFSHPNIVILKQNSSKLRAGELKSPGIGMANSEFFHEKGLITKPEVRSIVSSKLNFISNSHIFWDIGAGSGAVSIEAAGIINKGKIFAIEKNIQRINMIEKNIDKFNISNINIVHAELPKGLENLPDPDRIFIGGGGKDLEKILKIAINRLTKNGRIVVNTVLIQNLDPILKIMKEKNLNPDAALIQISKLKKMPYGDRFEALNPVWIIYGKKEI